MRTLGEIEKVIGPIARGPIIGGEVLLTGSTVGVVDPATGEVLTEIALGGVDDALRAVDAAEQAMPDWNGYSPRRRSDVLRRAFELMTERQDAFARIIVLENGKSYGDAMGEVAYAAEFFRWYAEEAVRLTGSSPPPRPGITGLSCYASRSVFRCSSPRGTSPRRWRLARLPRRWQLGALSCSNPLRRPL